MSTLEQNAAVMRQQGVEAKKSRWFYLYIHKNQSYSYGGTWGSGRTLIPEKYIWKGPFQATDAEIARLVFNTKMAETGVDLIYRLVYSPAQKVWIWDMRSDYQLATSDPIPGYDTRVAGSSLPDQRKQAVVRGYNQARGEMGLPPYVGATNVSPPITGIWPIVGFPAIVHILGAEFRRAEWKWPKKGIFAQYREAVPTNSRHLYVLRSGRYIVSHRDEVNPDMGSPSDHFIRDVMKRPASISPIEAELRRKAASI